MKHTILVPTQIEISFIEVRLPVRYDDEDMPYDFPLREGDTWNALIHIDTGKIEAWPPGETGRFHMKVCDEGTYILLAADGTTVIATIENGYVPSDLIPGEYGDYVEFQINEDGAITNWPKKPDVSQFFPEANEE